MDENGFSEDNLKAYKDYIIMYLKSEYGRASYFVNEINKHYVNYKLIDSRMTPYIMAKNISDFLNDTFEIEEPESSNWMKKYRKLKINSLLDE